MADANDPHGIKAAQADYEANKGYYHISSPTFGSRQHFAGPKQSDDLKTNGYLKVGRPGIQFKKRAGKPVKSKWAI